ncbi:hypothetical protein GA0070607_0241 [Micromonospora coriariae]|uniref:Uncharacterized protein n=1 Tax=Micromonospora coriariae TaxID=285665 RepID=A0A1C4U6Z5_9ACTN|nr:hypothetical protein [Micromonospora coriariae]SCE67436.1 hypothetical protein GA0070607_0241 [Micromonospora coriariae]
MLDLSYRPMCWSDPAAATAAIAQALPQVTVAIGNIDEVDVAVGTRDPEHAAGLLRDWPLEHSLCFANAAGAIVASRLPCSAAMPDYARTAALARSTAPQPATVDRHHPRGEDW